MSINKRMVTTEGIISQYKSNGIKGVKKYFDVDMIYGLRDDSFMGDLFEMLKENKSDSEIEKWIKLNIELYFYFKNLISYYEYKYINKSNYSKEVFDTFNDELTKYKEALKYYK